MNNAKLLVERGSTQGKSQDWGEYAFLALPSPGDRIAVKYRGQTHYLTVICLHHRPIARAQDDRTADLPQADVVAMWTSADDH